MKYNESLKTGTSYDKFHLDLLQQWNGDDVFSFNTNVICANVPASFLWNEYMSIYFC